MSSLMKILFILAGFSLALVIFILPSIENIEKTEKLAQVVIGDQIIIAEMARTPSEREKGLSGVRYLEVNKGMLFVFENKDYHSFWMKGVRIPLDIVWISEGKIVGFTQHILPEVDKDISELSIYRPPVPVDRVLELRAGRVKLLDAMVGDSILVKPLVPVSGS